MVVVLMKRAAKIIGDIVLGFLVLSILFSVGSQQFMGRTWGWSVISGRSMLPTLEQGDFTFIVPWFAGKSGSPRVGDIVAFEDSRGNKVLHRIVDSTERGYITKGDRNPDTDQQQGQPPLAASKIDGTALTIGSQVIKLPLMGALVPRLLTPVLRRSLTFLVVAFAPLVAAFYLLGWGKERSRLRRQGKLKSFYSRHETLFTCSGLILLGAFILMSAMVKGSSTVDYYYGVSETGRQAVATSGGVSFGILPVGSKESRTLTGSSSFPWPMLALFVYDCDALTFAENPVTIPSHRIVEITATVEARRGDVGRHVVPVTVLMLPEILPGGMLRRLAKTHELLPTFATSLVSMLGLAIPPMMAGHWLTGGERRSEMRRARRRRLA